MYLSYLKKAKIEFDFDLNVGCTVCITVGNRRADF